jgi:hypothetical protein
MGLCSSFLYCGRMCEQCPLGGRVLCWAVQVYLGMCRCPVVGDALSCLHEGNTLEGRVRFGLVDGVGAACCWGAHGDGEASWLVSCGDGSVSCQGARGSLVSVREPLGRWS